jgi:hypothetical protein
VDHTFAHVLRKAQILLFLAQMGPSWSMPTLEILSFPVFFFSLAAAQLLSHMQPVFVALSKLKHPESVELMVAVDHYNIDGSWLAQLALKALKNLNCFWLISHNTSTAHISGAQLASFLVNHPKLNDLVMYLGPVEVLCSPEEKTAIDTCMAKMDKAEIGDMILTVQQPI